VYIDEKAGDAKRAQDRIKWVNIQLLNFMSKGEREIFTGNLLSVARTNLIDTLVHRALKTCSKSKLQQ